MSYLQEIQVTAQQVAEAISSVLGMDVTIFDARMFRVAGTGYHRDTIGEKIVGYSVGQQIIETGKEYIVADVRTDDACLACARRSTCMELAQLGCPITLGKETIGVISLIAFSPRQQSELIEKRDQLLDFVRRMADLLSAKVVEKNAVNRLLFLKNQLATVLNFVTEGIIAIDDAGQVININYAAEKMLGVKAGDVLGFPLSEVFPGTPIAEVLTGGEDFADREVKIWRNGRQHHYRINAKAMRVDGAVRGAVASFRLASLAPQAGLLPGARISFDDIIGTSDAIEKVKHEARRVAASNSTVLLTGESGTGKEIFARAIHGASDRSEKPFIAVNCAAIPEMLLESELFGYEAGSFTGARAGGKPGKFQLAHGGTLFLDEIGDMPLYLQAKILRVLQDKAVERVGAVKPVVVDVRIIAATNRNLDEMVAKGQFREDLFYRLNVFPIHLPALRERKEDIPALAGHFLSKHAAAHGKKAAGIAPAALRALLGYAWPGNIRELENAIECAVLKMSGPYIELDDLLPKFRGAASGTGPEIEREMAGTETGGGTMAAGDEAAIEAEKLAIQNALAAFGSSVAGKRQAAASLGISIATLYRKLRKYGL